jgi:phenylpyruvate tautomerase PptA (4-oxalocrotonate tautomerase family)
VKLLRTIRLDPSDTFVFERAAEPGEWAVSGAFAFWNTDPAKLQGKSRAAFRGGFLGIDSFGWSTLVQIVEAKPSDRAKVVETLAQQLVTHLGAPDLVAGRTAAEDEVTFAQSLCDHSAGTLIAVRRLHEDGAIREAFRTLQSRGGPKPMRVFSFLEIEGEDEGPAEGIDLVGLAGEKRK